MPDRAFLSCNTPSSALQTQWKLPTALKMLLLALVAPEGYHRVHRTAAVKGTGVTWIAASVPAATAEATQL